jgi:hypothetical protein
MTRKTLALAVVALSLTACGSMTELRTEALDKRTVPTWYLEHDDFGTQSKAWWKPWDREGMYYAVAEDVSPNMEFAIKKATLKAKAKIADRVNGEMNNRTTIKYDESGSTDKPTGRNQSQDVIVNLIAENVLRTYGVEKKMVIFNPELNNYRAFVMLKISQKDVATLAEKYDENKQVKLKGRFDGKTVDETATEVLKQARQ